VSATAAEVTVGGVKTVAVDGGGHERDAASVHDAVQTTTRDPAERSKLRAERASGPCAPRNGVPEPSFEGSRGVEGLLRSGVFDPAGERDGVEVEHDVAEACGAVCAQSLAERDVFGRRLRSELLCLVR
jgi:hypothetical protein